MTLIMRPSEDGPFYVAKPAQRGDGYVLVPYCANPDAGQEMTAAQVEEFRKMTCKCGGFVHGRVG